MPFGRKKRTAQRERMPNVSLHWAKNDSSSKALIDRCTGCEAFSSFSQLSSLQENAKMTTRMFYALFCLSLYFSSILASEYQSTAPTLSLADDGGSVRCEYQLIRFLCTFEDTFTLAIERPIFDNTIVLLAESQLAPVYTLYASDPSTRYAVPFSVTKKDVNVSNPFSNITCARRYNFRGQDILGPPSNAV